MWQRVNLAASGGGADGQTESVRFRFEDNDAPELEVSRSSLYLVEGAAPETFSVNLTKEPSGPVTVSLTLPGSNSVALMLNPLGPLTFTPDNWDAAQTVTVSVPDNTIIEANAPQRVDLAASGGGADGQTESVHFWFYDNDAPELEVSQSGQGLFEGAAPETFSVNLTKAPSANVTVTLTPRTGDSAALTLDPLGPLTFTPDNWDAAQTVEVSVPDNTTVEANGVQRIYLAASGGGADGKTAHVDFLFYDNDASGLEVSQSNLYLFEGGGPETFSVNLTKEPSGPVTVSLTLDGSNTVALTLDSSGPLTFTPDNWDAAQKVEVSVPDNTITEANGPQRIHLAASGGGADGKTAIVIFEFVDNDALAVGVALAAFPNPVTEGEAVTITATLSEAPTTDVVIPLTFSAGTAEASDYGGLITSSITIFGTGSGTTGAVDIETFEDDGEYDDETFTVALDTLPAGFVAENPSSVEITISDNDIRTVTLAASPLSVVEGSTITVTATLSEALPTPVTIDLTDTHITTEPADYDPPASITIAGGLVTGLGHLVTNDDDIAESDESFTLALGDLPAGLIPGDQSSVRTYDIR